MHPDGGTIEILGEPFQRGDRRRLFEVGALVESPSFYPYLSARANLREVATTGAPVAGSAAAGSVPTHCHRTSRWCWGSCG